MKTVVFQSFRTKDVPRFIATSLSSVASWAGKQGYEYQFLDDRFLHLVPEWYRQRAGRFTCVITDLARLIQAQALLSTGFDQVVWVDADVLIFRPSLFTLPEFTGFRYCKEVWLQRTPLGIKPAFRTNNSVCTFGVEARAHLEEYIDRCLQIVRDLAAVPNSLVVGTDVITRCYSGAHDITNVGMISPVLLQALILGEEQVLADYAAWQGSPIFAANLCNTFRAGFASVPGLFDHLLDSAVFHLEREQGGRLAESQVSIHPVLRRHTFARP